MDVTIWYRTLNAKTAALSSLVSLPAPVLIGPEEIGPTAALEKLIKYILTGLLLSPFYSSVSHRHFNRFEIQIIPHFMGRFYLYLFIK